jgi:hypothetical protein
LGQSVAARQRAVTMAVETNLRALKPSRKKPKAGDVFVMQTPDDDYLFGRVITAEAAVGPMTGCILFYVFRTRSAVKKLPDRAELAPSRLLLPPLMTNRLPWSRGYFETVGQLPLEPGDVLKQHCFRRSSGQYYDEANHELPGPVEPVGDWALHSYRTIDDQVSDALGFPRVPD